MSIDIYYEEHGQGENLILIGGLGSDHQVWRTSLRLFSQYFHVLIFDNRGAGQSSISDKPYSIESMANDVIQLMQRLGMERAHIVGHSMGGCIAQQIAIYHAQCLNKLVLVSTRAKRNTLSTLLLNMRAKLKRVGVSEELLTEYMMPFLFSEHFLKNKVNLEGFIHWALKNQHPQSLVGYERQLNAVAEFDSSEKLNQIHAPTLIMLGDEDILVFKQEAEYMVNAMPNAILKIIPNCGHMPHVEQANEFSNIVLDFLRNA